MKRRMPAWFTRTATSLRARVDARQDTEFQQALIRFIIGLGFFLYFASTWFSHPEEISHAIYRVALVFMPLSAAILVATLISPEVSVPRRIAGAVLDFTTASVLLYVGGVSILMVFGVMMTRRHEGIAVEAETTNVPRGVFAAGAIFGVIAGAIQMTPELDRPLAAPPPTVTAQDLGRGLLIDHVLAFEVISLLLLIAIIGAIVIARRRDPGEARVGFVPRKVKPSRTTEVSP